MLRPAAMRARNDWLLWNVDQSASAPHKRSRWIYWIDVVVVPITIYFPLFSSTAASGVVQLCCLDSGNIGSCCPHKGPWDSSVHLNSSRQLQPLRIFAAVVVTVVVLFFVAFSFVSSLFHFLFLIPFVSTHLLTMRSTLFIFTIALAYAAAEIYFKEQFPGKCSYRSRGLFLLFHRLIFLTIFILPLALELLLCLHVY